MSAPSCSDVEAYAQTRAEQHQPDEKRGGCTCGFCVWSIEHVVVMAIREAWQDATARPLPAPHPAPGVYSPEQGR